jgi:hypothetical protein
VVNDLLTALKNLQAAGDLSLPLPGAGQTALRHRILMQIGCRDQSLGRLAEGHTDAIAILAEAGRGRQHEGLYGVWASDGPQSQVTAKTGAGGHWQLEGVKQYCSGASLVDVALVTAHANDQLLLFEVPVELSGITVLPSTWANPALANTMTGPVAFKKVELPAGALLGASDWYLARPGFWHGAVGPAACWAGGAQSLIQAASHTVPNNPHARAQVGALEAIGWGMEALLNQSGNEIDADPVDAHGQARYRALKVRHLIERWCTEVLDRFGRATGPQLLVFDPHVARQFAALSLYIRQCHAERDLQALTE